MGSTLCEVGSEAVSTDILHLVFVWERRDDIGGEILAEGFVEEDEIGEAATDTEGGFFKRGEIALGKNQ